MFLEMRSLWEINVSFSRAHRVLFVYRIMFLTILMCARSRMRIGIQKVLRRICWWFEITLQTAFYLDGVLLLYLLCNSIHKELAQREPLFLF